MTCQLPDGITENIVRTEVIRAIYRDEFNHEGIQFEFEKAPW